MLTKNYYALLTTALMGQNASGDVAIDTSGTTRVLYSNGNYLATSYNYMSAGAVLAPYNNNGNHENCLEAYIGDMTTASNYEPVRFGSGSTPATVDDYKLESVHTNGLTVVSQTAINQSLKNNVITRQYSYILKNTKSTDVVVGEIGLFYNGYYGSSSSRSKFMLDRTVLDEPITIAPGGTGTVVYTLTIKVPTCPTE